MLRTELYRKIKELNIAKDIEQKFHQNFTRVPNIDLEKFLFNYRAKVSASNKKPIANSCNKAMVRLVSTLQAKKYLNSTEAEEVLRLLA